MQVFVPRLLDPVGRVAATIRIGQVERHLVEFVGDRGGQPVARVGQGRGIDHIRCGRVLPLHVAAQPAGQVDQLRQRAVGIRQTCRAQEVPVELSVQVLQLGIEGGQHLGVRGCVRLRPAGAHRIGCAAVDRGEVLRQFVGRPRRPQQQRRDGRRDAADGPREHGRDLRACGGAGHCEHRGQQEHGLRGSHRTAQDGSDPQNEGHGSHDDDRTFHRLSECDADEQDRDSDRGGDQVGGEPVAQGAAEVREQKHRQAGEDPEQRRCAQRRDGDQGCQQQGDDDGDPGGPAQGDAVSEFGAEVGHGGHGRRLGEWRARGLRTTDKGLIRRASLRSSG